MSELNPFNTTCGDLCTAALQDSGRLGVGQTALAEDVNKAWARLQWMLQGWERKRWLVYHLVTYSVVSTGATSYTVGPGGAIDTNAVSAWQLGSLAPILVSGWGAIGGFGYAVNDTITLTATPPSGTPTATLVVAVTAVSGGAVTAVSITSGGIYPNPLPTQWTQASTSGTGSNAVFGYGTWALSTTTVTKAGGTVRPAKLESAFVRQLQNPQGNQVDYPLTILESMEDYNNIALKSMVSFPYYAFLDSQWGLANLYAWPVPQAAIYGIFITVLEQLPCQFLTLATAINLPFEYYQAVVSNLALLLRIPFSIPTFPGDPLPAIAKASLATVRGPNTQIGRLRMPAEVMRDGLYNIFSDRTY